MIALVSKLQVPYVASHFCEIRKFTPTQDKKKTTNAKLPTNPTIYIAYIVSLEGSKLINVLS